MTELNTTLVVGEDRELVLDLKEADGAAALVVAGWTVELRLGSGTSRRLTKALTVDGAVTGRVSCAFAPLELSALGSGSAQYSVWRMDAGTQWLLAYGTVAVLEVI